MFTVQAASDSKQTNSALIRKTEIENGVSLRGGIANKNPITTDDVKATPFKFIMELFLFTLIELNYKSTTLQ